MVQAPKYKVFISHAGEDKEVLAAPIYEKLTNLGIPAFFDKQELQPGAIASLEMTQAMETAHVGLFLLSPEFLAKYWPMHELNTFLRRVREAEGQCRTPPILIPVFYRLTVDDCKYANFIEKFGQQMLANYFFQRLANGEVKVEDVQNSLKTLAGNSGIEVKGNGKDLSVSERETLIQKICDDVKKRVDEAKDAENANDPQKEEPQNKPQINAGRDALHFKAGRDINNFGNVNTRGDFNLNTGR